MLALSEPGNQVVRFFKALCTIGQRIVAVITVEIIVTGKPHQGIVAVSAPWPAAFFAGNQPLPFVYRQAINYGCSIPDRAIANTNNSPFIPDVMHLIRINISADITDPTQKKSGNGNHYRIFNLT